MRLRDNARLSRFKSFEIEPGRAHGLPLDHPAVVEGRTLFPGTVKGTFASPRFLVSGANNPKVGKVVEKGRWAGMPIYTLTLEERATCPRSCELWAGCYSNAMPFARRSDAFDPDFIPALKAEVLTLVREVCSPIDSRPNWVPPRGIVIRLHVLGDFFSVAYVRMWADLLRVLPEVNCYGYTARRVHDEDPASRDIAMAIQELTDAHWDRFSIRTSSSETLAARSRSIVVDEPPTDPGVILCPAQVEKTAACGSCGLCWADGARDKVVGFLRHGMKRGRRQAVEARAGGIRQTPAQERVHAALLALADERGVVTASTAAIARGAEVAPGNLHQSLKHLAEGGRLQFLRPGARGRSGVYRVFAEPQAAYPEAVAAPLPAKTAIRHLPTLRDPIPRRDAEPIVARKPDDPLMRPHAHRKGGWGQLQIGSADQFDIGTAEERVANLAEEERSRIAATYGAAFKPKAAAE